VNWQETEVIIYGPDGPVPKMARRLWWIPLLAGGSLTALGIVFLLRPGAASQVTIALLGIVILLIGSIEIPMGLALRHTAPRAGGLLLAHGTLGILAGTGALLQPYTFFHVIIFLGAAGFLFFSLAIATLSVYLQKANTGRGLSRKPLPLKFPVLLFVLGLTALIWPGVILNIVTAGAGVFFVIVGLFTIGLGRRIKRFLIHKLP